MSETCRLRRGKGYEACPDEAVAFLGSVPAGGGRPPIDRVEDETPEGPIFSRKEAPREEKGISKT